MRKQSIISTPKEKKIIIIIKGMIPWHGTDRQLCSKCGLERANSWYEQISRREWRKVKTSR